MEGIKYDDGKEQYHLLFWEFIREMARVLGFGADKYGEEENWKKRIVQPDGAKKYESARMRHAVAPFRNEKTDPETGFSHYAHEAVNAMFLYWLHFGGGNKDGNKSKDG